MPKRVSKDKVYDENGIRRFHGAFTGGFSAGYFNTVGSEEGFTPTGFISSRKQRVEFKQYTKEDFNRDVNALIDYLKREKDITCLIASQFTACKIIYEALSRMKKNIPEDYSLITFDYSYGLINPNIARVIQNQEHMAKMAVSVLIKLINKENVAVKLYSPYTIFQGNSIKKLNVK